MSYRRVTVWWVKYAQVKALEWSMVIYSGVFLVLSFLDPSVTWYLQHPCQRLHIYYPSVLAEQMQTWEPFLFASAFAETRCQGLYASIYSHP